MATYDIKPIKYDGEFTNLQKAHLKKVLDELAADTAAVISGGGVTPTAAPAALTDNSGGTADNTVAAVPAIALSTSDTYTDSAVNSAVNTPLTAIKNDIADLTAKINALRTALISSGVLT